LLVCFGSLFFAEGDDALLEDILLKELKRGLQTGITLQTRFYSTLQEVRIAKTIVEIDVIV
jgi:hypothetical protein